MSRCCAVSARAVPASTPEWFQTAEPQAHVDLDQQPMTSDPAVQPAC